MGLTSQHPSLTSLQQSYTNIPSAFFNNISYAPPVVPALYTAITSSATAANAQVYGDYTHSFVLGKDEVIEIVINNNDPGKHPFHLHGHAFQAIWRSDRDAENFNDTTLV
jgi:iron transport multicopper oxidase